MINYRKLAREINRLNRNGTVSGNFLLVDTETGKIGSIIVTETFIAPQRYWPVKIRQTTEQHLRDEHDARDEYLYMRDYETD